jgi:hypothetical protein
MKRLHLTSKIDPGPKRKKNRKKVHCDRTIAEGLVHRARTGDIFWVGDKIEKVPVR